MLRYWVKDKLMIFKMFQWYCAVFILGDRYLNTYLQISEREKARERKRNKIEKKRNKIETKKERWR